MAKGFFVAILAVLLFGGVAAVAYQAGIMAAGAGVAAGTTAVAAYPYHFYPFFGFGFGFLGFLFPLFFLFLLFGLARAAFGGGRHWDPYSERRRMHEQWHREMTDRPGSGTTDH